MKDYREGLVQKFSDINERLEADLREVEARGYYTGRETDGDTSDLSFLDIQDTESVSRIYEILLRNEQWDDECPSNGKFVQRLVRTKTWIDPIAVHLHTEAGDMPERVFCSGAFMNLEVFYLPMNFIKVQKFWAPNLGEYVDSHLIDINAIGMALPTSEEVFYGTFRPYNQHFGICLALRGNQAWLREYINRSIHWEYVECDK